MKAELIPENGDPPIPITRDVTIVGRREYCDVRVDHPSLSKRHAVIVKTDGLLVIRDLATTNGTKVKGQKVRWAALLPDDRITLGGYKLRVYLGPDDVRTPSEMAKLAGGRRPVAATVPQPRPAAVAAAVPAPAPGPAGPPRELEPIEDELELVEDDVVELELAEDELVELELAEDDGGTDGAGWQKLMGERANRPDDEVIIELD